MTTTTTTEAKPREVLWPYVLRVMTTHAGSELTLAEIAELVYEDEGVRYGKGQLSGALRNSIDANRRGAGEHLRAAGRGVYIWLTDEQLEVERQAAAAAVPTQQPVPVPDQLIIPTDQLLALRQAAQVFIEWSNTMLVIEGNAR